MAKQCSPKASPTDIGHKQRSVIYKQTSASRGPTETNQVIRISRQIVFGTNQPMSFEGQLLEDQRMSPPCQLMSTISPPLSIDQLKLNRCELQATLSPLKTKHVAFLPNDVSYPPTFTRWSPTEVSYTPTHISYTPANVTWTQPNNLTCTPTYVMCKVT